MVILKEIVIESFAVTDMTAAASAALFPSESKGSGFHANERPQELYLKLNLKPSVIVTHNPKGLTQRLETERFGGVDEKQTS